MAMRRYDFLMFVAAGTNQSADGRGNNHSIEASGGKLCDRGILKAQHGQDLTGIIIMPDGILAALRKIPPLTRFLCGSYVGITGLVLSNIVARDRVLYVARLVYQSFEIWRLYTSFFLGSFGLSVIFEVAFLYRTMDGLETGPYARRSGDLAWQLFVSCAAIVATSYPVNSFRFLSPFLLCIVYLSSSLAPPGTKTNFFGLVTLPVIYLPYLMLVLDFLVGGPRAMAQSLPGALVGHLWWLCIWGDQVGRPGPYANYGKAPRWLANWLGDTRDPEEQPSGVNMGVGVQVVAPRTTIYPNAGSGASESSTGSSGDGGSNAGYKWGSGQRLGNS
ncbi:hypothetical protein PM082_014122 [Marasmius tenuissimus]|nr:hypothetical protein PM082_014122 [Marasmius tenuissimus]